MGNGVVDVKAVNIARHSFLYHKVLPILKCRDPEEPRPATTSVKLPGCFNVLNIGIKEVKVK